MGHSGKAGENIFWAMNRNKPGIIKRILNALERFIARIRGKDAYLAVEQRQAAERLRDMLTGELKRAYGTDVKGEAAVESDGGKRHSLAGANSRTADLNSLGGAYQMYQNGVSMDTIRKRTGWWLGKDGKWRYEISDKEMRFNPDGFVKNPTTVGDYVKHDQLFAAYPWIADIPVYVSDVVGGDPSSLGRYIPSEKIIEIKAGITSEKARTVLAHELQHVIQNTEHFASGTNTVVATRYLINLAYDLVKNNPEFVAKKKPQDKMDYIIGYIEAKDNTTLDEYARYYYFRNHGETEARNTAKRLDMTDAERKAIPVVNDGDVYTRESVRSEFIDNLREMGYNKKQIDTIMKEGVSYDNKSEDEQKSLGQVGKRGGNLGRTVDGLLSQNLQRGTQREVHGNGEVQEVDSAEKAGQIGSVSGGVSRRTDSGASGLGEAGKRLNEVSKPEKRFSLSSNVEQTKDLIAVHNMTAAELEKSLDLGGLPMPSIAIIKAADGHSEYGDVSLVFGKDTIDPKKSARNKVYGGDAWTPTFPKIDYKANEKVGKQIRDKYYDLSRKYGYDNTRALYDYAQDLSDVLTSEGGEKAMIDKLYGDTGMMQIYLMDTGRERVANVNKETKTVLTDGQARQYENLIDTLGRDEMNGFAKKDGEELSDLVRRRKAFIAENEAGIRKAFEKTFIEDGMSAKDAAEVSAELALSDLRKYVLDTFNYIKNGAETVKTEFDSEATDAAIKKAADGEGYRKWINNLFGVAEEKSGIRNSKDAYTASGNRRSFEALHWENNLENIVNAMLEQDETGGAFFSGSGIWGVSAKKYNSISEIKNDSSRLRTMNEAEYNALKEQYGARMQEIAQTLIDPKNDNYFIASDDAYSLIVDAVRNSKDESGILRYLKKYNSRATEKTASDIAALVRDIAEMPTGYFEAKPQRAVGFDEVKAVILPDNASGELVSRLESDGINTVTYKAGDENSRLEALNGVRDVRFSLTRANDEYMKAVESGNVEEQQRLVDEAAENAGYDTVLYHGTQSFGFTQIDVSKYSDDGMSFFATSNPEMAQTYSAKSGTREISRKSGIENLSLPQVVDRLNAVAAADTSDYDRYTYRIMNRSDTETLKKSIQSGIKELRAETERLISEYADRLAKDFNGEDELKHSRLRSLLNALDSDSASKLSANLYTVLNHNEIFDDAAKVKFGNLEADIRLLEKLAALKTDEDVVVREDTDRYDIVVEDQEKARNRLEKLDNSGNYVLRGRTEGFLEIDGNGHNWNDIFTTLEPKGGNTLKAEYDFGSESLKLSDRDGEFAVIPAKSVADAVSPMARAFARRYGTTFATTVLAQTKDQLKNSATAEVKIKSTGKTNTRDIANFAREQGYPGVKITDIYDNGGRGSEAGRGDVYIFFNPDQDVKSADPITYDDSGNVIPLTERFDSGNRDIRWSLAGTNEDRAEAAEFSDSGIRYSLRKEDPPKKTLTGYKVFVVKNGKLYPPMVANPDAADTPVGVWLNADIGAQAPDSKTGRKQVKAGGKGTQGGSGSLAFRPGWHLGETPLATQFDRTNPETGKRELFPENFVWAECEIAADKNYQEEAMSYGYTKSGKFQHSLAGLPKIPVDGYYKYRTNPNPDTVPWLITGAMKVTRLLDDAEVNRILESKGLPPKNRVGGNKTLADLGLEETAKRLNGDGDGNIRYSLVKSAQSELKALQKENEKLRQDVDDLKQELQLTHGRKLSRDALISSIQKILIDRYGVKLSAKELYPHVTNLYDMFYNNTVDGKRLKKDERVDTMRIIEEMDKIVDAVIENAVGVDDTYVEMKKLLPELRNTKLVVPVDARADAAQSAGFENWAEFRKANFGRVGFANEGLPVDTYYMELSERYPELFPDGITHPGEQAAHIADVVNTIRESGINEYQLYDIEDERIRTSIKNDVMDIIGNAEKLQTFADRAAQKVEDTKLAEAMHYGADIAKLKRLNAEKVADIKAENRKRLSDMRRKYQDRVESVRERYAEARANRSEKQKQTVLRNKVLRKYTEASSMLDRPTTENHFTEAMREPLMEFLAAVDITTGKSVAKQGVYDRILRVIEAANKVTAEGGKNGLDIAETDLNVQEKQLIVDSGLLERMSAWVEANKGKKLTELSSAQLFDQIVSNEPPVGYVHLDLLQQPYFAADTVRISYEQHTEKNLRLDSRASVILAVIRLADSAGTSSSNTILSQA